MPVMNGFDATEEIRKYEFQKGIYPTPIIALTASSTHEYQQRCMDVGMNDFLSKPFTKIQLQIIIAKWKQKAIQGHKKML